MFDLTGLVPNLNFSFFYLDTAQAAELNDLKMANKPHSTVLVDSHRSLKFMAQYFFPRLVKSELDILSNGGTIVPLDDPRLTHVIFDPDDVSRRLQIRKRVCRYVLRIMQLQQLMYHLIAARWKDI